MNSKRLGYLFWGFFLFCPAPSLFSHDPECAKTVAIIAKLFKDSTSNPPSSTRIARPYTPSPGLRQSRAEEERLKRFLEEPTLPKGPTPTPRPTHTDELIKQAEKLLSPQEAKAFSDWLRGQFFEDSLVSFEDHFLGRQRQLFPSGPTRYNRNGERPFDGYLTAREHLKTLPLSEIGLSQLLEIHKKLMSRDSIREDTGKVFQTDQVPARNSQGLKDSELGQIRSEGVGFEVDGKYVPSALNGIGHYLTELSRNNIYLKHKSDGSLSYADIFYWRTIDSKKPLSDQLVLKLQELEKKHGISGLRNLDIPEVAEAQRALLSELTDRLWKETISDLEKAQTNQQVIQVAARFQQDLISIHPFLDGNGRLARLLTEKLLESKGLPPPLYTHWGEDATLSRTQMESQIARGVLLSQDYHEALKEALTRGESFDSVPNPVLAIRAQELLGGIQEPFDPKAFLSWVSNRRESLSDFSESVRAFHKSQNTPAAHSLFSQKDLDWLVSHLGGELRHFSPDEFLLWKRDQTGLPEDLKIQVDLYMSWLRDFISSDSETSIRLASGDFQRSFGRLSETAEEHEEKMNRFYRSKFLYRGVPVEKYLSDQELARLMAHPTPLTNGNGVPLHQNPESHFPVFQNFNHELLRDGHLLSFLASKHAGGTSETYFRSGMVSFSELERVGRDFQFPSDNNVGVFFVTREREPGTIHTGQHTPRMGVLGHEHEREIALVGGVDPESILSIEVKQREADPKTGTAKRTKRAKRIDFNTIEITEITYDENNTPTTQKPSRWRISPDGSTRILQ